MTSRTITITETPYQAPVERSVLKIPVERSAAEQVYLLIKKMEETAQELPFAHQEEIIKEIFTWKEQFFSNYRPDSPVDEHREAASHALLFLAVNLVEYRAIGYAKNIHEKVKWVTFSNQIRDIVKSILPKGTNAEAFIKANKATQLEFITRCKVAELLQELMPKIHEMFTRLEELLFAKSDQTKLELAERFRATKQRLMEINDERANDMLELHGTFDQLTKRLLLLSQSLEQTLGQAEHFDHKILVTEANVMKVLDTCEAVVPRG